MAIPDIQTERLLLRPWTRADIDAMHLLWTEPDVRRYLWDDLVITRETAADIVESHLKTATQHNIGYWAVHFPADSAERVAGFCGFRFIDDGRDVELMYGFRREYWGKGLATEACAAALDYMWRHTELPVVYARTDPPNSASVDVMLRLGMTHHTSTDAMITYVLHRPTLS
jgi:ribosomal-protein-alanine N-acetyltransferase